MNLLRRIIQSSALLGLVALTATARQTQSFVQKTKTINAAVLLLDSDKPPLATKSPYTSLSYVFGQTAAPFAFYDLDAATGVKPDGWVFSNPYSPGFTTTDIAAQYFEMNGESIAVGKQITKRQGAYWTVRLSQLSESQIANYNVLLVAPRYYLSLNTKERDLLRRFVDGGGVLWIDLGGLPVGTNPNFGVDKAHGLPYSIDKLDNTAGLPSSPAPYLATEGANPILNAVRAVSDYDLLLLNNSIDRSLIPVSSTGQDNNAGPAAEFMRYRSVVSLVNGTNYPVVTQARIGDGSIVVTARGAAVALSNSIGGANLAFQAVDPTLNARGRAAARLASNITTLGGEGLQPSGSAHKTSGASAPTPAPVLTRFTTQQPNGSTDYGYGVDGTQGNGAIRWSTPPNGAPVTYKGYLVATVGDQIVVMDAIPGRDLDGDGDPDDGIADEAGNTVDRFRDSSFGKPLDVVWVSRHLNTTLSPAVCAEIPEIQTSSMSVGGQRYTDQIVVHGGDGALYMFPLAPVALNNRLIGGLHDGSTLRSPNYKIEPPTGADGDHDRNTDPNNIPTPPTVYEGLAYVADSLSGSTPAQGRVWVADLSTASPVVSDNRWYAGSSLGLPQVSAEPTVGYIPINDNSGGTDRVLYLPGTLTSNYQPALASLWLGTKGEVPDSFTADGTTLTVTTRAAAAGGIPVYFPSGGSSVMMQLAPHITIVDEAGNPLPTTDWITSGPSDGLGGVIKFGTGKTTADFTTAKATVRIDYTLDWGKTPQTQAQQILRGTLRLPVYRGVALGTPDSSKRILGPIALTAHGTMHLVEATPSYIQGSDIVPTSAQGGDSYFAIREDGGLRGQFRVVARYSLYQKYTQTFGGGLTGTTVPSVFTDADYVQNFLPPFPGINSFTGFRFAGGVALRDGIAFTAVNARRGGGLIPVAMIAAFKAEPETPELRIGAGMPTAPVITQFDWARSSPVASVRTPATSSISGNSLVVDTDNETIRIENLATVLNGEIVDCLSESQPIGIGSSNQTQTFRQPELNGDRWSPLLWFGLWNGASATATPFVGGNSVYMAATTVLPSLLNNEPLKNSGVIWEVDADASTSGLYATALPDRPWITQQSQLVQPAGATDPRAVSASPYFRMPQNVGIATFDDFKARLIQTQLGTSTTVLGLGGGDGIVTAFTDTNLFGLSQANVVICDEGRLLTVDSSGNPVSNTFGARFSGIGNGGTVANQRGLPRPVKAYPVGTSDTLVVDAGSNRVMRLAADGSVLRSVEKITLDPKYKPAAYRVNEPLDLKDPRDATTFEGYVYKGANEVVTNQGAVEYWIRYLVADSGNRRIVELADRFTVDSSGRVGAPVRIGVGQTTDPDTGLPTATETAQVGVLVWQSPSLEGTANVGDFYNSISRVYLGVVGSGRYVYVAGVSRTRPTRVSAGLDNPTAASSLPAGGGGAMVIFDPTGGTRVIDQFGMPDTRSTLFFRSTATETTGTFVNTTGSNVPAQKGRSFRGVQAVTAQSLFQNGKASISAMVTDLDAVYEFRIDADVLADATQDPTGGGTLQPYWMIDEAAFTALRSTLTSPGVYDVTNNALSFRPSYARRLDSGQILLVNGYQGLLRDRQTAYTGEVTLLDGRAYSLTYDASNPATRNLGFTFDNVQLGLRTLTGIRGLVSPVFADRR